MNITKNKSFVDICKNLGIETIESDSGIEFEWWTDAGEDFVFALTAEEIKEKGLAGAVYDYYEDFDEEEHIMQFLEAKIHGVQGIPSVFRLVEDAKTITAKLENLFIELYKIRKFKKAS